MRRLPALAENPVRFLVLVVIVDVLIAAVLRFDRTADLLSGQRDWHSWLGLTAALYLFVVAYALMLVVRDSTAMRRLVRRGEGALAAHAETTNDWLWETTPDLVITYCSPQVEELLGYRPSELVGRNAHELMTPSSARRSREALADGLVSKGWHGLRSEWLHADGHVVTVRHSGAAVTDDDGRLIGFRGNGAAARADDEAAWRRDRIRERIEATMSSGSDLRMALQPIIDVHSRRMIAVEALARFDDGRPPDVWFEEAGMVGLRPELEMLAVQRALDRVPELPPEILLSINACPEVIGDPRFAGLLLDSGIPLSRLIIEITEHVRIDDYVVLESALDALRLGGAAVAVDDAGAGYASLGHVLRLRPDVIKLDRSIVAGLDVDPARRTLITALVLLALDIGATVTAEGIETAAELEAVAGLGVDHAQGYLIGRPSVDISTWPSSVLA